MFCRSLFVLFLFAIVLSVLHRYTDSDYPFRIFKLFLCNNHAMWIQCSLANSFSVLVMTTFRGVVSIFIDWLLFNIHWWRKYYLQIHLVGKVRDWWLSRQVFRYIMVYIVIVRIKIISCNKKVTSILSRLILNRVCWKYYCLCTRSMDSSPSE